MWITSAGRGALLNKWYFNPSSPGNVPPDIIPYLDERGVKAEDLKLAVKTDLDRDCVRCDNYIIVTDVNIFVVSGSKAVVRRDGVKPWSSRKLESKFEHNSSAVYDLADFESFRVEELLSSARFIGKKKDGAELLLANLSNTFKNDMYTAARLMSSLAKDGKFEPDKEAKGYEDRICPKCGNRYADEERKICAKCMDKGRIIRRTGVFFIKYRVQIAIVIGLLVLSSALGVLSPYISSGFYYDEVLDKAGRFYGELLLVLGIIFATRLISMVLSIFHNIITSKIAARLVYDLKKTIFSCIERLSLSFFTGRQTGGLMTQVNRDANTIYWFFCDGVPYFAINLAQVIVILIIMLYMNWSLTLLSVISVPLVIVAINFLFDRMWRYHEKRFTRSRAMNSVLSDVLSGVRVVKAFSKEKEEINRFGSRSRALAEADKKASLFSTIAFPAIDLLLYVSNIIVWGVGGWMVIKGSMTYGILLTFISYMNMIYAPMFSFVDMASMASDSLNAMNRLLEIIDARPDVVEPEKPVPLGEVKGKVEFRNVSFSYEKNRKVIDGISFVIEPGRMIGIVGHTGAGKSTLANLLIRLYDVEDGGIYIDDVNIKDIAFSELRRNISIVSQETYLFMGTIMENIRYARPDATEDEVIDAAKIAGAHDFIMKLPDGYSTRVGVGFKDLSGGERQRVSIARAILRNPKILILDEATAAMDTETERQIQSALERLVEGRTTIVIAHRLSTLRDADKLIVVENGKMPEFGTHKELIESKGIYYNLYKLQAEALKNVGIEA